MVHRDPESAARQGDSPVTVGRTVLVDTHPDGRYAVVLIEYNEPPHVEPYTALCWRDDDGWRFGAGHGGWSGWYRTHADADGAGPGFDVTNDDPPPRRRKLARPNVP